MMRATLLARAMLLALGPGLAAATPVALAQAPLLDHTTDEAPLEGHDAIGVLEVRTYGVSEAAGEKFEQSVEETLADVGFRVVRSGTVQEKLREGDYVPGCTFGPCMREVNRLTGLRRVLVARVQGVGQSYSVVVSLVETDTGQLVSQVAQSCPVCTVEEAISTATLAVVELITAREAAAGPGTPAMGAGGAHPADLPGAKASRRVRRAGWLLLGVGVAAGAVGGALLATGERDAGLSLSSGGGAFAISGISALLLSRSF
jgi:hypothetical protein